MSGPLSAMLAGREAAQALMVDECVVTAEGAEPTFDDETGEHTTPEPDVVYRGRCKVQRTSLEPREVEAGERVYAVEAARVDIPMETTGIKVGQRVTVLRATYDPDLAGISMRVVSVGAKTWATARRLRCTEET